MKITEIVFSPTGTGRTVAQRIAAGWTGGSEDAVRVCDLTPATGERPDSLTVDGIALFVAPVYGGRVAETAVERFGTIRAAEPGRTPAIVAVVYGNRDYEDALLELRDIAARQGFVPLSGGAFVGEHSYSRPQEGMPIAEGRPDAADCAVAERFGAESRAKYDRMKRSRGRIEEELSLPGARPYKVKGPATPATPTTDPDRCTGCGICAEVCPTGVVVLTATGRAISTSDGCIKCCACLKYCPTDARRFDTPYTRKLFQNFSARREPELFL